MPLASLHATTANFDEFKINAPSFQNELPPCPHWLVTPYLDPLLPLLVSISATYRNQTSARISQSNLPPFQSLQANSPPLPQSRSNFETKHRAPKTYRPSVRHESVTLYPFCPRSLRVPISTSTATTWLVLSGWASRDCLSSQGSRHVLPMSCPTRWGSFFKRPTSCVITWRI